MAIIRKKNSIKKEDRFENQNDLKKLSIFVTIVNQGVSSSVISLLNKLGCMISFVQYGEGTASRQILSILGIEENKKEVVFAIVERDSIDDIKKELQAFFLASKKNKGIGFSIQMTSIIGVQLYKILTHSI